MGGVTTGPKVDDWGMAVKSGHRGVTWAVWSRLDWLLATRLPWRRSAAPLEYFSLDWTGSITPIRDRRP